MLNIKGMDMIRFWIITIKNFVIKIDKIPFIIQHKIIPKPYFTKYSIL